MNIWQYYYGYAQWGEGSGIRSISAYNINYYWNDYVYYPYRYFPALNYHGFNSYYYGRYYYYNYADGDYLDDVTVTGGVMKSEDKETSGKDRSKTQKVMQRWLWKNQKTHQWPAQSQQ